MTSTTTTLPEPLYLAEEHICLPANQPRWSGLVYLPNAFVVSNYTVERAQPMTTLDALYQRAVVASRTVPQSRSVHIYWLGREWGTLRGQC